MLLAIDIGNSRIGWGLFAGRALQQHGHLPTDPSKPPEAYAGLLKTALDAVGVEARSVSAAILCSVVPRLTPTVMAAIEQTCRRPALLVGPALDTGLTIRYTDPRELGADRLANAAGAYDRYRTRLIVVDLGTATTFSVVNATGEFLGGAIATGLVLSADALVAGTARLPQVELTPPPSTIGRDTRSNLQAGLLFGHAALVDGMVTRMGEEIGAPAKIVATGGLASVLAPLCRTIEDVRPHLTLEGLEVLHRRNPCAADSQPGNRPT